MSRIPFSKVKSKQLYELLTTKFVNKFKINKIKEKNLLEIIDEEVDNLLNSGQAYEKNLLKLEAKLYATVKLERNKTNDEKNAALSSK
jgi:DNA replication protein DnaD